MSEVSWCGWKLVMQKRTEEQDGPNAGHGADLYYNGEWVGGCSRGGVQQQANTDCIEGHKATLDCLLEKANEAAKGEAR